VEAPQLAASLPILQSPYASLVPFGSVEFSVDLGLAYPLTMAIPTENRILASVSPPSGCCDFTVTYQNSS